MGADSGNTDLSGGWILEKEGKAFLGGRRIALLRAIERSGSITRAAKEIGMSYKAAWEAVEAINNLSPSAVVLRATGGKHGGGSHLTDYGRRLVELMERMQGIYTEWLDDLAEHIEDPRGLLGLMERFNMQTSARNQYRGTVEAVISGPVSAEVEVRLTPASSLIATITNSSAERMDLKQGTEVHALVKASSVLLADEGGGPVFSARNRLCGPIARIVDGPVSSEVTLDIGDGKLLTAVVTRASRAAMGLGEGQGVCALFKASSVILARP